MTHAGFVLMTVLAVISAASTQKQAHPDFAGDWVLDSSRSSSGGAPLGLAGRGGAPPVAAPAGGSAPMRAGGDVPEPTRIKDVKPIYPRDALFAKIGGTAILEAVIGKDGRVRSLRVVRSLPGLDEAALDAVSQWEYTPTKKDGALVEVLLTISVSFTTTAPSGPATRMFGERGAAGAPAFTIKQDAKTLKVTRTMPSGSASITYRLDGKASKNQLVATTANGDLTFAYMSRWDADTLVTRIRPPQGASERKETMALDGDTLVIRSFRIDSVSGAESIAQISVYTRRQ
jgi:TonB family protein